MPSAHLVLYLLAISCPLPFEDVRITFQSIVAKFENVRFSNLLCGLRMTRKNRKLLGKRLAALMAEWAKIIEVLQINT